MSQMLVSAMAAGALFSVPSVASALVVLLCAAGVLLALRTHDVPASRETAVALERSKTVIGELDAPGHARHFQSAWKVDA